MVVMTLATGLEAGGLGALIGLSYGLIGAGGSILGVPLLVYVLGMDPHRAIGTDTVAATLSAVWTLAGHARAGSVHWMAGGLYAVASIVGAATGAHLGEILDGRALLAGLGALMLAAAASMIWRRPSPTNTTLRPTRSVAPWLAGAGFLVGAIAGLVGAGGGFLTVPALVLISGMPVLNAVATSLVSVAAVAATTATSYSLADLVYWPIAGLLIVGGLAGGYGGVRLAERMADHKRRLTLIFSAVVAFTGLYVTVEGLQRLL